MFDLPSIAKDVDWYARYKSIDGKLGSLAYCKAFQHIEREWPTFKDEPHNLNLGLALDEINHFSLQSSKWSTWHVASVNHNLPPFLSIKKEHLLLSLLVPSKQNDLWFASI